MTTSVGYKQKLEVSADGSSNWIEIHAAKPPTLGVKTNMIDITTTASTGRVSKTMGLQSADSSFDIYDLPSTAVYKLLHNSQHTRTALHFRYKPDGTTVTHQQKFFVSSMMTTGGLDEAVTSTVEITGTGDITPTSL